MLETKTDPRHCAQAACVAEAVQSPSTEAAVEGVKNKSEDMDVDDENTQAGTPAACVIGKCCYPGMV